MYFILMFFFSVCVVMNGSLVSACCVLQRHFHNITVNNNSIFIFVYGRINFNCSLVCFTLNFKFCCLMTCTCPYERCCSSFVFLQFCFSSYLWGSKWGNINFGLSVRVTFVVCCTNFKRRNCSVVICFACVHFFNISIYYMKKCYLESVSRGISYMK